MIWNSCLVWVMLFCLQLTNSTEGSLRDGSTPDDKFSNPIAEGADPWVTANPLADSSDPTKPDHFRKRYYWCMSDANRQIAIYATDDLTRMGKKYIVWQAPKTGPYSKQIWAPELHFVDGHWCVYVAASDGDNANHLAYVLKSKTDDVLSEYEVQGPLATGDGGDGKSPNIWAIDMTLLRHKEKLYAIWSGWDAPGTDRQYLYIAPMESPTKLGGPRVRICANDDYLWERLEPATEHRGLNEGPEVFQANGRTFLFYSCGASWLPTYKLGMLELQGDDPLDPKAWIKSDKPAFASTDEVYGVGHSCFVPSPDGKQWWHVYHAKRDRNPGWRRAIHVQPMHVDEDGTPNLGAPLPLSKELTLPSGTNPGTSLQLKQGEVWRPLISDAEYSYYGHHQFLEDLGTQLRLGRKPDEPVNDYRCGEKVVFNRCVPNDFSATVKIKFAAGKNSRDAGILFRCSRGAVGFDSQRAYFAGLVPETGIVVLGKTDGNRWQELKRAKVSLDSIDSASEIKIAVNVRGSVIEVSFDDQCVITADDSSYPAGSIGLRVVDCEAVFEDFKIQLPQEQ